VCLLLLRWVRLPLLLLLLLLLLLTQLTNPQLTSAAMHVAAALWHTATTQCTTDEIAVTCGARWNRMS
jgi:hypothetical protein